MSRVNNFDGHNLFVVPKTNLFLGDYIDEIQVNFI